MDDENHELIPINEPDNVNNEKTSSISKEKKYSQYYDENAEKKNFTNISNILKICIIFIPTITSILLYVISLEGCHESQFDCIHKLTPSIVKKFLLFLALSAFLFNIQIFMYFFKICGKKPLIITIISFIYLCLIYDTGANFDKHGAYNRILFLLFSVGCFICLTLFILMIVSIKKKPFITILILLIFYMLYVYFVSIFKDSCKDWEKGLKGSSIDNTSGCILTRPNTCYYKILNGYLDYTKLLSNTCDTVPGNSRMKLLENSLDKNMMIVGYPRIEKWSFFPDSQENLIQKNVAKKLINVETENKFQVIKNLEVITNFYHNPPKVTVDLKKSPILEKERNEIFEKNKPQILVPNILYVFIDSISRANFKRKLPKLYSWIENKYHNNDVNPITHKSESFQFLKFHGLGTFTGINMMPALFGLFNNEYGKPHYKDVYKQKGFVTGQALNYCGREVFDLDEGGIQRINWEGWDHELSSFFCDGNFTPYDDLYKITVGLNSIGIRCLYNKSIGSYSLDYANQFWRKYPKNSKLFRLGFYEAHEGTYEVIKYSDDELFNFFNDFEKEGHLENTLVIIHSDHGLGMAGIFSAFQFDDYVKELVLPSLFLIAPTKMKNFEEIRKTLKHNEQSFTTHFTLFNTLQAILNGSNNKVNYSKHEKYDLFYTHIPRERDCTEFQKMWYYNNDFYCSCDK